jgi:hypothetical protein
MAVLPLVGPSLSPFLLFSKFRPDETTGCLDSAAWHSQIAPCLLEVAQPEFTAQFRRLLCGVNSMSADLPPPEMPHIFEPN